MDAKNIYEEIMDIDNITLIKRYGQSRCNYSEYVEKTMYVSAEKEMKYYHLLEEELMSRLEKRSKDNNYL